MTGEVLFGPAGVSPSTTITQLKKKLRESCEHCSRPKCAIMHATTMLQDDLSLADFQLGDCADLTLVNLYEDLAEALDLWRTWAKACPIRHIAYGDGGRVHMNLTLQEPASSKQTAGNDACEGAEEVAQSDLLVKAQKWPFAERRHFLRQQEQQLSAPSLGSTLVQVAEMAQKYDMKVFYRGELVWGPRWECWLRKNDWTLSLCVDQWIESCDLD